jgi:hypothetical protein
MLDALCLLGCFLLIILAVGQFLIALEQDGHF